MPAARLGTTLGRRALRALAACALAVVAACSGGGGDPPPTPEPKPTPARPAAIAVVGGDGPQTAPFGEAPAATPTFEVRDAGGRPVAGVTVTFEVTAGGGTIADRTDVTDAQGRATARTWRVGSQAGVNTLSATASGVARAATVSVTARLPRWTMMVYLAGDNTLAFDGIKDLDEMEAAGSAPDVNVLVQAEYSPTVLARSGADAAYFNRPNFNTFRYVVPRSAPAAPKRGPDGQVTDLGNRNMVDPAQLAEFVAWARQTAPAERYALVLWNHGGGYAGLIEDVTSGGTRLMSLAELRRGLSGGPPLDVVDFDMCLMAGFETLVTMKGLARHVVLSEEVVPGAGNPYTRILRALQRATDAPSADVARLFVDEFHAGYANNRASTTMSAYDLAALPAAEAALGALARGLTTQMAAMRPVLAQASAGAQKFQQPGLTDAADLLDSLLVRTADAGLRGQITTARAALTAPEFRLRSRARVGAATDAYDVRRASGLHLMLPSDLPADRLPSDGVASFAGYQTQYPAATNPWTGLLDAYLNGRATRAYVDQGDRRRFEAYVVWDSAALARGVDIDYWLLEPDGELYSPAVGSISPNGRFTPDSYVSEVPFEGWLTNRSIESGEYRIFAHLYDDPRNVRPLVDLVYRSAPGDNFTSLYRGEYPQLSTARRLADDPTPTFDEIDRGAYTDIKRLATWTVDPSSSAASVAPATPGAVVGARAARLPGRPAITAQQVETLRRLASAPRRSRAAAAPRSVRALGGGTVPRFFGAVGSW